MKKLFAVLLLGLCTGASAEKITYSACGPRADVVDIIQNSYREKVVFTGNGTAFLNGEQAKLFLTVNYDQGTYTLVHFYPLRNIMCYLDSGTILKLGKSKRA